jgi:RNA polymerase sigma-70 factor, ECF subfamily
VESREERFRHLYEMGRPRVAAYAVRRTVNADDAADVVAETFAIAWRRLETVPDGERGVPWLFGVARKVIANRIRRTTSQSVIVRQLARQIAASNPTSENLDAERLAALSALDQLTDADREILMLVAWDGLTSQELGWVLGCTSTAARIRLQRARAHLNRAWSGHPQFTPSTPRHLEVPEP